MTLLQNGVLIVSGDIVALLGFGALFGLIALRVPVGIAMGLVGIFGFAAIRGITPAMNLLAISPIRVIADYNLSVIPLFILMGIFAGNSGLSRELFRMGNAWFGPFRGGAGTVHHRHMCGFLGNLGQLDCHCGNNVESCDARNAALRV